MGKVLLSLAPSEELTEEWLDVLTRRGSLIPLELTGEQFNHFLEMKASSLHGLRSIRDLIPAELARNWPFEHLLLSNELKEQLIFFIEKAGQCKVKHVSLNLGLENKSMQGAESQGQIINLLRKVTDLCQRSGLLLGLSQRFPELEAEEVPTPLATVYNTYHDSVNVCLDIFPAELSTPTELHGVLRKYFYKVSQVRFITYPNLGQKIHPDFLSKASQILRQEGYEGDIVIAPHFKSADYIPNVIQHFSVLEKAVCL